MTTPKPDERGGMGGEYPERDQPGKPGMGGDYPPNRNPGGEGGEYPEQGDNTPGGMGGEYPEGDRNEAPGTMGHKVGVLERKDSGGASTPAPMTHQGAPD